MQIQEINFQKLDSKAILPTRGSEHAAGLDLSAVESVTVPARGTAKIRTGLAVAVPVGYYGRIAPRSGLAAKFAIDVLAGVVDSDYRGELICILINHGDDDYSVKPGDRIAQFIIEAVAMPVPKLVEALPSTNRGDGGFGSTGR